MTDKVKVSVVTPTLGRKSLIECVQSVAISAIQLSAPVEQIVLLDGPDVCDKWDGNEDEIRTKVLAAEIPGLFSVVLVPLPRLTGRAGAVGRTVGTALTRGEYVCYLDDDCTQSPQRFLSMCKSLDAARPQLGEMWFACHLREFVFNKEHRPETAVDYVESVGESTGLVDTNCYFLRGQVARQLCGHWSGKAFNPAVPDRADDRAFFRALRMFGFQMVVVPESLVSYSTDNVMLFQVISEYARRVEDKSLEEKMARFQNSIVLQS